MVKTGTIFVLGLTAAAFLYFGGSNALRNAKTNVTQIKETKDELQNIDIGIISRSIMVIPNKGRGKKNG